MLTPFSFAQRNDHQGQQYAGHVEPSLFVGHVRPSYLMIYFRARRSLCARAHWRAGAMSEDFWAQPKSASVASAAEAPARIVSTPSTP